MTKEEKIRECVTLCGTEKWMTDFLSKMMSAVLDSAAKGGKEEKDFAAALSKLFDEALVRHSGELVSEIVAIQAKHTDDELVDYMLEQAKSPLAARSRVVQKAITAELEECGRAWAASLMAEVEVAAEKLT